jgi:cell shape-determining protein MreC
MSDHIPDLTKMISDTPRMHSALMDAPDAGFANIWRVGCDIERELTESNQIIRQQQLLDEENLRLQERIKRLEQENDALRADLLLWNEKEAK